MEITDKLARWIIDQGLHHKKENQLQEVQHHKDLEDEKKKIYQNFTEDQ